MSALGFSHICMTSLSPERARTALEGQGYAFRFKAEGLTIPPQKRPFLRRPADSNDLVFLAHSESPALELVFHHNTPNGACGPYALLLPSPAPAEAVEVQGDFWAHKFALEVQEVVLGVTIAGLDVRTQHYRPSTGPKPARGMAGCLCGNLNSAKRFWTNGLGFKETQRAGTDSLARLSFNSPVPAWSLDLLLVEAPDLSNEISFIDDDGVTCLSFLVRDLGRSLQELAESGAKDLGEPFQVEVGGKVLTIAFARGPWNELVELLEIG